MNGGTNFRGRETGVMVCFAIANLKRRPRASLRPVLVLYVLSIFCSGAIVCWRYILLIGEPEWK